MESNSTYNEVYSPDYGTQDLQGKSKPARRAILKAPSENTWSQGIQKREPLGFPSGTEKIKCH